MQNFKTENQDLIIIMNDWQKLISKALEHMTESELAKQMGVSQPTVNAWKNGEGKPRGWQLEPSTVKLKEIIAAKKSGHSIKEDPSLYEIESKQEIPIIAMATAGEAHDYSGIPVSWQETISVDIPKRIKVLGIKIIGDSMAPDHKEGCIAIVTPDLRPINGDLVIANIKKMGPVFKSFRFNGDPVNPLITLTSINPLYEPIQMHEKEFFWIWPVAEVRNVRRRF